MLFLPGDYVLYWHDYKLTYRFTWNFWEYDYVCFQYLNNSLVCRWKITSKDSNRKMFE